MSKSFVINARNCNDGLASALELLSYHGVSADSRNGPVLRLPGPVTISYENPSDRVMFSALRDANPFFHLFECIWMLAGRNDAASVGIFAKQMLMYANEDGNFDSAYGHRWHKYFDFDQTAEIIRALRVDPSSRRAVIAMWDAPTDLGRQSKDIPCNTHIYFEIQNKELNMTVCNRSNDAVWGAFGANYVHMSFLQEYIAASLNCYVGTYYQISNNLHVYINRPDVKRLMSGAYAADDRYLGREYAKYPLHRVDTATDAGGVTFEAAFKRDCVAVAGQVADGVTALTASTPWMRRVAVPLLEAHKAYRAQDYNYAFELVERCEAWDWREAAQEWLVRRSLARDTKIASGVSQ
jgi:hypothetical protein